VHSIATYALQVAIYKPSAAKPSVSDGVYVVAKGFRGVNADDVKCLMQNVGKTPEQFQSHAMIDWQHLPQQFIESAMLQAGCTVMQTRNALGPTV
jgi:hypothetical protein